MVGGFRVCRGIPTLRGLYGDSVSVQVDQSIEACTLAPDKRVGLLRYCGVDMCKPR